MVGRDAVFGGGEMARGRDDRNSNLIHYAFELVKQWDANVNQ